ncbi:PepSY domain-containing protein [Kovacikia minuta CCNUW1]|uniref:PepSY-associated TM helix domain-containing protein n=1 Tax=Kovacikia minuta TaxID=2931930 RepID=UPI001CCE2801|nr:PepSY-associated TM helix domain-containing protein [Kovacikia minuta]UBF26361.1 PepSY domain-containing protein [Kovacikia minuta CCNUW1]
MYHGQFHKLIRALHGMLGIVAGLLLVVISLSGAGIVFHEEMDHALNRSLWYITPQPEQVSLDVMLASVQATHPKLPVGYIQAPQAAEQSYVFNQTTRDKRRLQTFVNPYTGKVLGSRIWEYSFVGFLYTLHHDLFVGNVGQIIVGVVGGLLLLMAMTGVMLWTGWRKLAAGLRIRWNAPLPLLSYDIHKVGGIVSHIFLTITAVTGIAIVVLHLLPMFNQTPEAKPAPQTPMVTFNTLMQKADAAIPEGKTTFIELPEHDPQKLTVRKKLPNQETGRFDLSVVELDRSSGEVVQATKVEKAEGIFKLIVTVAALHFGTFGGLPTRILYVFVGFMPTILLVTGLITWKRRRWLIARREEAHRVTAQTQANTVL